MNRKFGIELEIVRITRETAIRALRAVGINVRDEGYNHTTRNYWKLVSDSSVRGGFEVVSPVLRGEAGIEEAMTVAAALDDAGAGVNRSCGFHVHFDAADLSAGDIKTIVKRYAAHEAEIDAVMPPSRRGDANQFCAPLARFLNTARFEAAATIGEMIRAQSSRYYKVNLRAYQCHGTIEFRQHSGTLNSNKIAHWVRFLAEFIDECKRLSAPAPTVPVAEHPAIVGVQARLAEMFTANRTVTLAAMCERFGWLPHTARAAVTRLRRAGMRISPVRINGHPAYRLDSGLMARAGTARREETLWSGISESVVRYYQRRAAVLSAV